MNVFDYVTCSIMRYRNCSLWLLYCGHINDVRLRCYLPKSQQYQGRKPQHPKNQIPNNI